MAKMEWSIRGNFQRVVDSLHEEIMRSAASMQLVDSTRMNCGNCDILVSVYDKYFMRNESRASLTITLVHSEDSIVISAISAGGGRGTIFNTSWGAEEELIENVGNILKELGYC